MHDLLAVVRVHHAPDRDTAPGPTLAATGLIGFLLLGVLVSVLGPTLPQLRTRHDLDGTGGALLLAAFSAGSALGVGIAGALRPRLPPAVLLGAGASAVALGCAAVPFAPGAVGAGGGILLAGAGFGMVDLVLNLLLAQSYGSKGGAVLMGLSAAFGVSAVCTPLLVGRAPADLTVPYLGCAAGAVALLAMASRLRLPASPGGGPPGAGRSAAPTIVLLGAVLLGYVTVEGGVAGWETTHLLAVTGLSEADAARAVALFWGGLTLGRLVSAPLALRVHPAAIAVTALAAGTVALAVASNAEVSVVAYAVTGALIAPVFPAVITWHTRSVPDGRGATGIFAAGLAGPVLTSPVVGSIIDTSGAGAVPWVLCCLAGATTALALALAVRTGCRDARLSGG